MDLFDRRIIGRLTRQLPLTAGEDLLDFEMATTRPYGLMPPPFPNEFPENGRVEIGVSERALYFRVLSRTYKGDVARIPWDRVATFGPHKGEGKWKRWSLKGTMATGAPIQVSLLGKPRPSMAATLAELIDPDDPIDPELPG